MPTLSLNILSPLEKLFGNTPNLPHLKVFGYGCYPLLKPYNKHKLEPKTSQHVFFGYTLDFKGYICFNPQTHKTIVSGHVIFHDMVFPF